MCERETKWLSLFRMHLHRQPNVNTKLELGSPIVDRDKIKINCTIDYFLHSSKIQISYRIALEKEINFNLLLLFTMTDKLINLINQYKLNKKKKTIVLKK